MNTRANSDMLPPFDYIEIMFFNEDPYKPLGTALKRYFLYEDGEEAFTFGDALEYARDNGYKQGTITMIGDTLLDGKVYIYNNYLDDMWYEYGETRGYA